MNKANIKEYQGVSSMIFLTVCYHLVAAHFSNALLPALPSMALSTTSS